MRRADTLRGDGVGIQSVLIRKDDELLNGYVEVDATRSDDGGLVLRFADNDDYYLLAIRDDSAPPPRNTDNLQIYRRSGSRAGGFTSIFRKNVTWPRGTRHRFRFAVIDSTFFVWMDGQNVGSVTEPTATGGSGFGIRHYGASPEWKTRYTNFSWRRVDF